MANPSESSQPANRRAHRRRLQRPPNADGYRVETFAAVLARHGLTMGSIALCCLVVPDAGGRLAETLQPLRQNPLPYVGAIGLLVVFFAVWSRRRTVPGRRETLWITYLLYISIVEEVAFRLLIPALLAPQLGLLTAHVLSNLVFAGLHYVTLRWRLRNCIGTFFGGLGLAHLMGRGDLALVILVHWLGTYLNTPAPPSR